MDLCTLLTAGIAVDLADDKQLVFGTLRADSTYVGQPSTGPFPPAAENDSVLVAVFRDGHTLLPHPGLELRVGDQLLAIASAEWRDRLQEHIDAARWEASP